jgi:hypothetical protein
MPPLQPVLCCPEGQHYTLMRGWLDSADRRGCRDSTVYLRAISAARYHAMAITSVKLWVLGKEPIADANSIGYPIDCYTDCHMDYPEGDPDS